MFYSYLFLVLHSKNSTWWQLRDVVNEMTATETGQFRLPSQLDVNSGNMSETSNGGNGKWKCTEEFLEFQRRTVKYKLLSF